MVYGALYLRGVILASISAAYERVKLGSVNTMNHYRCETSLLPQAVGKNTVSKGFILKKSVCGAGSLYIDNNL